jgi:hypothetical protein
MTGAEKVLKWMGEFTKQNGAPSQFEIRCQLELAINEEKGLPTFSEDERKERNRLLELQADSTRWFTQMEFARLKELSVKMFATMGPYNKP